jgi:hypothetical protein
LLVTAGQAAAEEGKLSAGLIEPVDSSMWCNDVPAEVPYQSKALAAN